MVCRVWNDALAELVRDADVRASAVYGTREVEGTANRSAP